MVADTTRLNTFYKEGKEDFSLADFFWFYINKLIFKGDGLEE
jgi:hypothetical protein